KTSLAQTYGVRQIPSSAGGHAKRSCLAPRSLRGNQITLSPDRRCEALNRAFGNGAPKTTPPNSLPLFFRNPSRVANDFELVVTQNGTSADETVGAVVHREHQQIHGPDAFV